MLKRFFLIIVIVVLAILWLAREVPGQAPQYGVSFSKFHSDELGLNWQEVLTALLDDLKVRRFRFSAHWPLVEPQDDAYNFRELDIQMREAQRVGAEVILAVGRRLPGWPECHIPSWAQELEREKQDEEVLEYVKQVILRYRGASGLIAWQVENEPYLAFFARHICGESRDDLLQKEIALVKELDSNHPILLTDGGEFGTWYQAYRQADVFGTTMYLYIWNPTFGKFRYPIGSAYFRVKRRIAELAFGKKPSVIIELGAEPWLLQPTIETPIEIQLERMGIDKFREVLGVAQHSGFDTAYLWGAEWWYWLKKQGQGAHWDEAKLLFQK